MYLIVGLGNPGSKYTKTRHNIGFMVLDCLAKRQRVSYTRDKKYNIAIGRLRNEKIVLIKPKTFMNLSGIAVKNALQRYRLFPDRSLIVCDDLNLPFGALRLRAGGSDGGQKGLRSISEQIQTKEFPRMRIGIGDDFRDASEYVLSPFTTQEKKVLSDIIDYTTDAIEYFVENGIELTMSRFNRSILKN